MKSENQHIENVPSDNESETSNNSKTDKKPIQKICKYCKTMKLIDYHKQYCTECKEIRHKERIEQRRECSRQKYASGEPKKCKKCCIEIGFNKWYCEDCKKAVEEKKKLDARERARKSYASRKDSEIKQEQEINEKTEKEQEEKTKRAIENLARNDLLNKIYNHYALMENVEDLREAYKELLLGKRLETKPVDIEEFLKA